MDKRSTACFENWYVCGCESETLKLCPNKDDEPPSPVEFSAIRPDSQQHHREGLLGARTYRRKS